MFIRIWWNKRLDNEIINWFSELFFWGKWDFIKYNLYLYLNTFVIFYLSAKNFLANICNEAISFVFLYYHLFVCPFISLSIWQPLCFCPFICLSVCHPLCFCPFICLSVCHPLYFCPFICLFIWVSEWVETFISLVCSLKQHTCMWKKVWQ